MKTALAWFIANIGGITDFVLVIIFEILLFRGDMPLIGGASRDSLAFGGLFLIPMIHGICVGGYPSKNVIGDVINIIILAIGYIAAFFLKANPAYECLAIYAWGIIPSLILATAIAAFTACNMNEVVSRRMLYHNSNADIFELKMQYTINRFVAAFSSFSFVNLAIYCLLR